MGAHDTESEAMKKERQKRGPGRPTENNKPTRKIYVTLDEDTIEKAAQIGEGNVSAGIRKAVASKRTPSK